VDGGVLSGLVVVLIHGIEEIRLTALQRDVVVARLGCLKLTCFRPLRARRPVRLLLAETLVEGLAAVFVDVMQPPRQRGILDRGIVLVADHLGGVGFPTAKWRV
jgi:hypothetical protein